MQIEVRLSGIDLAPDRAEALRAKLADIFYEIAGTAMRSDVRINLDAPEPVVIGGELPDGARRALGDLVRIAAEHAVGGNLDARRAARVEFVLIPEGEREEIEQEIAEHRFQIAEREAALQRYGDQPQTHAMLQAEIERLRALIAALEDRRASS